MKKILTCCLAVLLAVQLTGCMVVINNVPADTGAPEAPAAVEPSAPPEALGEDPEDLWESEDPEEPSDTDGLWEPSDTDGLWEPSGVDGLSSAPAWAIYPTYGDGDDLDEHGSYTSREDVALYIWTYDSLPENFITKSEARELGWSGGGLEPYAPGACIGGDRFGNREGNLPDVPGRTYYECDIDTLGADSRGAKRLVFCYGTGEENTQIYYTADHYETFEMVYGDDEPMEGAYD